MIVWTDPRVQFIISDIPFLLVWFIWCWWNIILWFVFRFCVLWLSRYFTVSHHSIWHICNRQYFRSFYDSVYICNTGKEGKLLFFLIHFIFVIPVDGKLLFFLILFTFVIPVEGKLLFFLNHFKFVNRLLEVGIPNYVVNILFSTHWS